MSNISQFLGLVLKKLGIETSNGVSIDNVLDNAIIPKLNGIVIFSTVVAVAMIIASAYILITSGGEPEKISRGQKALVAAVIGMVIVLVARVFIIFILKQLGLN